MLLKRNGLPEEGELVICTVTKIYYNSIFVEMDEYQNKVGMIHISEVAPGRIRNLRDYVEEGKKIVCRVLKINRQRGHVDLSFRRVNENQRRKKVEEIKQEQRAEKLITDLSKELNIDTKQLYNEIIKSIEKDYDLIYPFFLDYIVKEIKLEDYIQNKAIIEKLRFFVEQRIKPPTMIIEGEITLYSKDANGLKIIKEILEPIANKKDTTITFYGGGKYKYKVTANNYKVAEKSLKDSISQLEKSSKELKANFEFNRK